MKKTLFILVALTAFFTSCQPELLPVPDPNLPQDSCRIKTAFYYGGSGGVNDSANFIYSAGKLIKVESEQSEVLYTYNGNRVIAMQYFEMPAQILYRIDSFYYINDTILSRIIVNDYDMYNYMDTVRSVIDFTYNGSRLSKMRTIDTWAGWPDQDTLHSDFRWTGDNITSILFTSNVWADDSAYYQYDANPNYFRNVSPNFFMTDPFFQLYVGLDPHIPLFISKNNAINYTIYTNIDYPIEYEIDSMSHPTMVRSGGFDYMGYKYECP